MRIWTVSRAIAFVAVVNLLLGSALFSLRPPGFISAASEDVPAHLPVQVQRLQERINAGARDEPFVLELTEGELTAVLAWYLARKPNIPFARPKVVVTQDEVVGEGVTRGLAFALPVRVRGTVGTRDGLPVARVADLSLGDTGIPGFIRDRVVSEVNANLDFSRYNMGLRIDAVEQHNGRLILQGVIK